MVKLKTRAIGADERHKEGRRKEKNWNGKEKEEKKR